MTDIPFGSKQFTYQGQPEVEEHVRCALRQISSEILERMRPLAIFVYGSVGRGEGTLYFQKGRIAMASDFEIGIVPNTWSDPRRVRNLSREVEKSIGHEVTLSLFSAKRIRLAMSSNLSFLPPSVPTIESYEISESAFFLYGKDIRTKRSFSDPKSIPVWEGLRLLFNRMAEFVISFRNGEEEKQTKTFNKLRIACGDALLVAIHEYHYLYRERLNTLQKYWEKIQVHTQSLNRDHLEFIRKGYAWKLLPQESGMKVRGSDYLTLREIAAVVLNRLTNLDMDIVFSEFNEFSEKYLKSPKLRSSYYKGFQGHPLIQNLMALLQRRISLNLYLSNIRKPQSLIHQIYACIPGLFFEQANRLADGQALSLTAKDCHTLDMYERLLT